MRVALDTNGLYTAQAGVARSIRGLIKGLQQVQPPDVEFWECAWKVENFGYRQPQRAMKTAFRELVWAPLIAPRWLRRRGTDLFHVLGSFITQPPAGIQCIVTLNDLAVLRHPERFRWWQRTSERRRLRRLSRADRIICISEFTANEAMQLLGLPDSLLEIVHLGCDFHPTEPPPLEREPDVPVPPEFFLFVGSLEPGKNLRLVREAYQLAEGRSKPLPPLLIVGARWSGVDSEGKPPPNWHYLGRQPDSVLVYLYRRARALVFPSKYEGFGFPVAEAMALGCPVICSRVASLPEVGGDAACYAELQAGDYYEAMLRLCHSQSLREDLVGRGLEQASRFSWRKCAAEVLEIYRRVHSHGT